MDESVDSDCIFREEGRSAKTIAGRPKLLDLLNYCRKNKKIIDSVIVYRLDRISRQTADYLTIRTKLAESGINLISATEPTGNSPAEKMIETILASFAQLDNDVKSERSKNGLQARFKAGLKSSSVPIGYLAKNGFAIKDPDTFEYIKHGWEMLATGKDSLQDVMHYLNENGVRMRQKGKANLISKQSVSRIYRNKFYCGILVSKKYGMEVSGQHQPMINESMFYAVQAMIDNRGPNRSGHKLRYILDHPEFPLRRFMMCGICDKPMTGGFSKGKNQRYGYYFCANRCGAPSSININNMEVSVISNLKDLEPTARLFEKVSKSLRQKYISRMGKFQTAAQDKVAVIEAVKETRQSLIEKNLAGLYSDELFREQLAVLDQKLADAYAAQSRANLANYNYEVLFKFIEEKLAHIAKTYEESTLSQKKALLCSIFPSGMRWMYPGISNTEISPWYQVIQGVNKLDVTLGAEESNVRFALGL